MSKMQKRYSPFMAPCSDPVFTPSYHFQYINLFFPWFNKANINKNTSTFNQRVVILAPRFIEWHAYFNYYRYDIQIMLQTTDLHYYLVFESVYCWVDIIPNSDIVVNATGENTERTRSGTSASVAEIYGKFAGYRVNSGPGFMIPSSVSKLLHQC